jgi:hypothetical protein
VPLRVEGFHRNGDSAGVRLARCSFNRAPPARRPTRGRHVLHYLLIFLPRVTVENECRPVVWVWIYSLSGTLRFLKGLRLAGTVSQLFVKGFHKEASGFVIYTP